MQGGVGVGGGGAGAVVTIGGGGGAVGKVEGVDGAEEAVIAVGVAVAVKGGPVKIGTAPSVDVVGCAGNGVLLPVA
jgi:hypothetical protein